MKVQIAFLGGFAVDSSVTSSRSITLLNVDNSSKSSSSLQKPKSSSSLQEPPSWLTGQKLLDSRIAGVSFSGRRQFRARKVCSKKDGKIITQNSRLVRHGTSEADSEDELENRLTFGQANVPDRISAGLGPVQNDTAAVDSMMGFSEKDVRSSSYNVPMTFYERDRRKVLLDQAYERCRQITAAYAKTFYLGTMLMPPEKKKAIWAIYVWCRRTDELVDGPRAATSKLPEILEQWERRTEAVFAGEPFDLLDLALWDTLQRYPQDIQPYRDMIAGQCMDLIRNRYDTFDELYVYCYRVASTVGLMSTAVMGLSDPPRDVSEEAIALGIANQLTNILRDVGEDARRGRIYIPLEDLERFKYSEADLMRGIVDDRWRNLMKFQIARAREYFQKAESGVKGLHADARFPVWASLILYRGILDVIEKNDYDVFRKRAYVPKLQKMLSLPAAYFQSIS
eukprot:CAMPEP_0196655642 /NCGR_PEP_ID=MMETSP1086-20130531/5389_1 /TAXON_ID=77921 /ORGANISM="Cyanoptyche  gloeocystis , Strain SAG4.97" /LENGTH=452 /DNA_ID=CAMNT_0041988057 /DNA_START=170 /DNA_END=1528 /DNA_ORIENTATION=-